MGTQDFYFILARLTLNVIQYLKVTTLPAINMNIKIFPSVVAGPASIFPNYALKEKWVVLTLNIESV